MFFEESILRLFNRKPTCRQTGAPTSFAKAMAVKKTLRNNGVAAGLIVLCCLFSGLRAAAQQADTAKQVTIHILNVRLLTHIKTDSGEFTKFIDSVAFLEGTDTLFCDSAYQNTTTKNFEAFGNVKIAQQDGTYGTCDYLRYTADRKLAFMQGNVLLVDGKNKLQCEELTYDLGTKTAEYAKWGSLKSDSTTVTSETGIYNIHTHEARFKRDVLIQDPKYHIVSQDLGYNTETKVETFYAHSIVTSERDRSVLETTNGTYDSKHVIARFTGHSSIWNDGQYIEADSMHYNKLTGYGYAIGNVISIDTGHHSKLTCGHAVYFRQQRILWAMIKPVMEQVNGKDTIYMRADTFYTAPMERVVSSRQLAVGSKQLAVGSSPDSTKRVGSIQLAVGSSRVDSSAVGSARDTTTGVSSLQLSAGSLRDLKGPDSTVPVGSHVTDSLGVADGKISQRDTTWRLPAYKYRLPDFARDTVRPVRVAINNEQNTQPVTTAEKKPKKGKIKTPKIKAADTSAADTTAPMYFIGYNHVLIFSDSMQGKCDSVCYTRNDSTIRMIRTPILWAHNSQITGDTILLYMDSSELRKMYVPNNAFLVSRSGPEKAKLFDQVQGKTLTGFFKGNMITNMIVFPNAECIYYATDKDKSYVGVDEATSTRMRIFFADEKITFIKFAQDVKHTITPMEKADFRNMKLSRFKWLSEQRPKAKEELFK